MLRRGLMTFVMLLIAALVSAAPIPYSGQLTEGGVLISGNRNITLSVYAGPFGGSPLYTQTETLPIVVGIYHTMINAPDAIWDGTDRWIGVSVNGGAELSPRVKVGWVPYAVKANTADSVKVSSGVSFAAFSASANLPDANWVIVGSVFVNAPAAGFATVIFNGFAVDGPPTFMQGEISIGAPAGSGPIQRFKYGALSTEPSMEMPVSLTRTVPVSVGPNSIFVYSRNTDNFFGSITLFHVSTTAIYTPKYYGP